MLNKFSLFLLLFSVSGLCQAERADRDKPIDIDADQVVVDDAKQISTFTGHVVLTQGTMVFRGDKVVVVQDKAGFQRGTAYGRTASFRQKREGLDEYVEGFGERIEYDTRADTVDFYIQARVKRAQDEVRGDHVTYNSKTEIFQADSKNSAAGTPGRVHAVLFPKPKEGAETKPALERK
ncbi:MAG TPA: lipopolysaccharide transport periplasmic protein LptA [Gallionella sp.]|jgi:lipopolysaccharide export system protein LptA|nr:lipopolysaccharide transport periplasmic protein LptA [Gallionella sp.]OGS66353.1 MAG: lipopolysaccharide transport periplasmic protein LptA [Gallionellales bacterium GWA2_54_124]HCI52685.1 lipopolysaccharide transport periplasmic protein LptA [Gallionella sp.]